MRKKQYIIGLDYTPEKQARLKKFVGIIGCPSVRAFVADAIDSQITYELDNMSKANREAARQLLGE